MKAELLGDPPAVIQACNFFAQSYAFVVGSFPIISDTYYANAQNTACLCCAGPPPPPPQCSYGTCHGHWEWDTTLNGGMGGWVWTGDRPEAPCGGDADRPPDGCWQCDPTIGSGAWLYIKCGGDCIVSGVNTCNPVGPPIEILFAGDPNDKAGSLGVGLPQYIAGAAPLRYAIRFSNELDATAPAAKVSITDQLDVTNEDLTTFNLGPIGFGSQLTTPTLGPGAFSTIFDMRPTTNLLVQVDAHLDQSSGLVTWNLQSLDPITGNPPADPAAGFLPPGGEGSVFFTVMPKQGLATGTQIQNQATVVFDVNAPINTPVWVNTLDNARPSSHVIALPATETTTSFTVQWTGTDVGAGTQGFTIYVSDSGGPFSAFQTNTAATSATFTGEVEHSYAFYSIATDLVGNVEGPKSNAEATTTVTLTPACATDVSRSVSVTRSGYVFNFGTQRFYQTVTLKNTSSSTINGPISLVLDSLSSNASLYNTSGATSCAAPLGSTYIIASAAGLAPGASVSVSLQFTDPTKATITYSTRVLAGSGTR
ncbi:MAG: hypothetical protein ABSH28_08485 [Acidobacteriota bacterium]